MKHLFFVVGELSGDAVAAWYVKKHLKVSGVRLSGVAGDLLAAEGVSIIKHYRELNVVGVTEIVRHLPRIIVFMRELIKTIMEQSIDEVVLVDFPGFNLLLAQELKRQKRSLKITYVSPPQLWCWGSWRIETLKHYVDRVIVMYPSEVAWYRERGLNVEWLGNPVYDNLSPLLQQEHEVKPIVTLLPGSRKKEVEVLLPMMAQVVKKLHQQLPALQFRLIAPRSLPHSFIKEQVTRYELTDLIMLEESSQDNHQLMASSCLAITKPGTVTLELALLGVPAVVMYKTSTLTYWLARSVVTISHMALPNLLLSKPVYDEFIQYDCKSESIAQRALEMCLSFFKKDHSYKQNKQQLMELKNLFSTQSNQL